MKISVSSYSFSQLLNQGLHTQFSLIPLAAELGFTGIEFTDLTPPDGLSEAQYAVLLREEAKRRGLEIVAYTVGANLLADDPEAEVERLCRKVDVAGLLGAPLLRHDAYFAFPENAPREADFAYYLPCVIKLFRRVTDYAETKGIKTCTENHGLICQDPERVEAIVTGVDSSNFGWLVDIGNFLCADCDPLESVKRAAPYAFHVHAKDFSHSEAPGFRSRGGKLLRGATLGDGVVPVKDCLNVLFSTGYQGFVTVEYEGAEPVLPALAKSISLLKAME